MKKGHVMTITRKQEIVRKVLEKSKGVSMLHGEALLNHVAKSVTLYELPTKNEGEGFN